MCFREVSRFFQQGFKNVSSKFQESFQVVFKLFEKCFKEVFSEFQGYLWSFKWVSMAFGGSLMGV